MWATAPPSFIRRAMGAEAFRAKCQEALRVFPWNTIATLLDYTSSIPIRVALYVWTACTPPATHGRSDEDPVRNQPRYPGRARRGGGAIFSSLRRQPFSFEKAYPIGVEILMRETASAPTYAHDRRPQRDTQTDRMCRYRVLLRDLHSASDTLSGSGTHRVLDRMEERADWLLCPHGENETNRPGSIVPVTWHRLLCSFCKRLKRLPTQEFRLPNLCWRGLWSWWTTPRATPIAFTLLRHQNVHFIGGYTAMGLGVAAARSGVVFQSPTLRETPFAQTRFSAV